jgi:uncharacterized protein
MQSRSQERLDRQHIITLLQQHQATLRSMGVVSLSLFGSIARDQACSDSDVDLIVELVKPLTFDRYMDVKFYLEDHLGAKVDLVSLQSLKPQIRETVMGEAIRVA